MNDIKYEKKRENVLHFWNQAFSTRENNANDSRKIIMQQRGHDSDVAGDVRSKIGQIPYTILSLPAIAKEDKIWISPRGSENFEIEIGTRIGIEYAKEDMFKPWRFYIKGNKYVSKK